MHPQEFDLVNQKVGQRFRIERVLGRGGMGVVYLARDEVLQEHVAFKTLVVTTPSALERLRQEVRLARKVTHTNVARTYDIGEHRGVHYLTMEYVDGIDLESQIATSALPLARALAICTDIARGLSAAHAEGIVHRDLKPANILVARTGRVVVTDFGIAEQVTSLAQSGGGFVGTPLYMAPEQVAGEPISDKTDVYALGLLLLEMLTQRVLFFEPGGSALRAAIRRTEVDVASDDELRGTSGVARDLLRACLQRHPKARPSAREVSELAARLGTEETVAVSMPIAERILSEAAAPTEHAPSSVGPAAGTRRNSSELGDTVQAGPTPAGLLQQRERVGSLAVMPMSYRGPTDDAFIAEALTDELVEMLGKARGLRVLSRNATPRTLDFTNARSAARELGVDAVVIGSVHATEQTFTIRAELVDVASGVSLWQDRFQGQHDEALAAPVFLARSVAEALRLAITTQPFKTVAPEAAELYLRARQKIARYATSGPDGAIALLNRAMHVAPDFESAVGAHALAFVRDWFLPDNEARERQEMDAVVHNALAKAPENAETQLALAHLALDDVDMPRVRAALESAIRLAPTSVLGVQLLGILQVETGDVEEGLFNLRTAWHLDPGSAPTLFARARVLGLLQRYDQANEILDHLPPSGAATIGGLLTRLRVAAWAQDRARVEAIDPEDAVHTEARLMLRAYQKAALLREPPPNIELMRQAILRGRSRRFALFLQQLAAELFCFAEQHDLAMQEVSESAERGLIDLVWLDHCPVLGPLRTMPGFADARRKVRARARSFAHAI